jgi:predicted nucleotidyltransferase
VTESTALERVRRQILQEIGDRPVEVLLYGSWAKATATRTSDIDIAIDPKGDFSRSALRHLREVLEELPVAYPVNVIDLRETGDEFKRQIRKEAIRWKSA